VEKALMNIENVLASVAVTDLEAATKWYERIFQRPADSTPMPEVAEWKFPRGGWLQVYRLPERAGGSSCTFAVDDLDQVMTHLQNLGVETGEEMKSERTRVIMIKDPAGNSLAFAQTLEKVDGSLG
jgi:predicted enzyme related to lactoylglutathione lyase